MNAIELASAEIGTVSSRPDGSVAFRVITAELRPSEAGLLCQFHGKAARVLVAPLDVPVEDVVHVETEMGNKTCSQRWRAVLFVAWKQGVDKHEGESFDTFYSRQYEKLIEFWKRKLNP